MKRSTLALLCVSVLVRAALARDALNFRDVAPVLQKYCVGCHNGDEPEGGLNLQSFAGLNKGGDSGAAMSPGDGKASLLVARITGREEPIMPPEDEPRPSDDEVAMIIRWIEQGAAGPRDEPDRPELNTPQLAPSTAPPPITALAFSPLDGRLAVARFGDVRLLNAASEVALALSPLMGKVNDVSFSNDGRRVVTASGIAGLMGQASIWDAKTGELLKSWEGHQDILYAARLSHDGRLLATAGYDRRIVLWDVDASEPLRTLQGHNAAIYDLAFGPDDQVLASASADATVKIWRVSDGERLDTLSQPLKEQYSVDVSPDGRFVIAGGEDNRIRMWRLVSTDQPRINPLRHARFAHEAAIQRLRFSADGKVVVSAAADGTLKVWSAEDMRQVFAYPTQPDSTQALAISADSQTIAVGRMNGSWRLYPLQAGEGAGGDATYQPPTSLRHADPSSPEVVDEREPNDVLDQAMPLPIPAVVRGVIHAPGQDQPDEDLFRFRATAGHTWIMEVRAARDESPLDSHLAVFDSRGRPVPRVQLRAVRDSYFTFRGKDSSTTGDFRLHNWEEMKLNQFLYANGEVVKLFHYPRGPDSGFNVYPNFGSRRGFFDTTPMSHALHEPCYIVEPHPPGVDLAPNGLPTFTINYENDDDSQRRLGRDSRLTFVAPEDGEYVVRLRDVRGLHGADFKYALAVRAPQPDFDVNVLEANPEVAPGAGKKFGVQVERIDGFDGPIEVRVLDLPPGFSVAGPLLVEPGHDRAWGALLARPDAEAPAGDAAKTARLVAEAEIDGRLVRREVGSLGEIQLGETPQLLVELTPDDPPTQGEAELPVIEIHAGETTTATIRIERHGYDGRVNFGKEDGAINSPHGVYVDNTGLNGILIVEGQDQREFFITAEPWVQPQERLIFVEAAEAGRPTSAPVILRVLPSRPPSHRQAAR